MDRASRKIEVDFSEPAPTPPTKKGRKVTVVFPVAAPAAPVEPTKVYMRDRTHTYLWLRDGHKYGYFLTMDSGTIEVARVDMVTEVIEPEVKADKKAKIAAKPAVTKDVYRVWADRETTWDLVPHAYDFKKAVEKYHTSLLGRTAAAEREMRAILGLAQLDADVADDTVIGEPPKPVAGTTGAVKGLREPRAERQPREPKPERVKGYTLQELCAELKKDPTEARKALRGAKVEKPGAQWEWPNAEAAAAARKVIAAV